MRYRLGVPALALCVAGFAVDSRVKNASAQNRVYAVNEISNVTKLAKNSRSTSSAEQDRIIALSILTSLADESERYRDQVLRTRTQARVADVFWEVDQPLARNLFLRAWKTAEDFDNGGDQKTDDGRKKTFVSRAGGLTILTPVPNLRSEVLRLAARRDAVLGETLIAKLEEAKASENSSAEESAAAQRFFDPTEPRVAIAKRLEVALQLLEAGDLKQAQTFAAPGLDYATSQGIIFLCVLRQKDEQSADSFYTRLLTSAASDPRTDATTVSLLSSYIFTPNLLVTATRQGRVSNQFGEKPPTHDISPIIRSQFFNVAARILLKRISPSDLDHTSAGRAGTYFTIARLLPLFEQYASNYVAALNAQLALLAPDAPETFKNGEEVMLKAGLGSATSDSELLPDILDQLASVPGSADRDALYVKAIRAGALSGDWRIREYAEKIDNQNLKERARSFVSLAIARSAITKKDTAAALKIINDGYLLPLHRVWALAQVARLVTRSDPERALQALNEATLEANRINVDEPDRVYAFVCVSLPLFDLDRDRWWGVVSDVIKTANAVPGFIGEEGRLQAILRTKSTVAAINSEEPSFNMMRIFELLARDDLQTAVSMANSLVGDAPRSGASLTIARSVLYRQRPVSSTGRK